MQILNYFLGCNLKTSPIFRFLQILILKFLIFKNFIFLKIFL
nr:MAG TPA: hypothetical protein [Caudoviricetes sp.]DAW81959.1 MAG TPA: hypothetical protein [Caudoviricetes sp.]